MSEHSSSPVAGSDSGAREGYCLAAQIIEVRSVLVSQLFRGIRMPIADPSTPQTEQACACLREAVMAGDAQRIAETEWDLRKTFFERIGQGLALSLLLQGDERLRQSCGLRPPAVNGQRRLNAMQDLVAAFRGGSPAEALKVALTQVELDQSDLKSFIDLQWQESGVSNPYQLDQRQGRWLGC